jgi:hypothetical protein
MVFALFTGIAFIGCGDDDGTEPEQITLADFEGHWDAQSYEVSSNEPPEISMDLIALGGSFTFDTDDAGIFTGAAEIPEALGGPLTLQYQGMVELVTQDSARIVFDPEIPPFITSFTGWFELSGNTLHVIDENTSFDFDQDGVEEAATFEGVMVRS